MACGPPKGHSTSQVYSISVVLTFHGDGGKVGEKDSLGSDHENGLRNTALTLKDCCEFLVKKTTPYQCVTSKMQHESS